MDWSVGAAQTVVAVGFLLAIRVADALWRVLR
jgi:hypothetical protein